MVDLATWATDLQPEPSDVEVARRALVDTVAVTLAAATDPIAGWTAGLPTALRWAAVGHALDFDDVHLPSTAHVSVVCAHATLATGGGAREYLAAAGVMARLGTALGWRHYRSGWHTTCTAGAPAASVAAGLALGLDTEGLGRAMALAVPGAGGVQRAFGTSGKALQVGFATDAGVRAARLAAAGADADPATLDQWAALVGASGELNLSGPIIPDGLAVKLHPCCYALQRPITATRQLQRVPVVDIARIVITTPEAAMAPLIHHDPRNGLQGKFSIEYAVVAALLDGFPDATSFTDTSVARPEVRELLGKVQLRVSAGGEDILAGDTAVVIERTNGMRTQVTLDLPQGHPSRPATEDELAAKVVACVGAARATEVMGLHWDSAAELLRRSLPGH